MAKNKDPKIDQINGEFKAVDNKKGDGEYTVSLIGDTWEKYKRKAKNKIVSKMDIKGFRKGKIPSFYIDKYVSEDSVLRNAAESALYSAYMFAMNQKTELKPLNMEKTTPKIEEINNNKVVYSFVFSLRSPVKLEKYKNLGPFYNVKKVTDVEINDEIQKVFRKFASFEKSKTSSSKNDIVVIDFEGTIEGKPFQGNSAKQMEVEIGNSRMLPDFEKQLIGVTEKQEIVIKIKFPEDYHSNNLRNAKAEFKTKIQEVRKIKYPEFNDELVQKLKISNTNTMKELKKNITNSLNATKIQHADADFTTDMVEKIIDDSKFIVSSKLIDEETDRSMGMFVDNLKKRNMKLEDYLKMQGTDYEAIKSDMTDDIETRFEIEMLLIEISKKENLDLNEDDLKEFFEAVKKQNPDARREQVDMQMKKDPSIKAKLQNEKIIRHLRNWNIKKENKETK